MALRERDEGDKVFTFIEKLQSRYCFNQRRCRLSENQVWVKVKANQVESSGVGGEKKFSARYL